MFVHMLPNEDTNMLSVDISVIYSIDTSRCFSIDKAYTYLGPTIYYICYQTRNSSEYISLKEQVNGRTKVLSEVTLKCCVEF